MMFSVVSTALAAAAVANAATLGARQNESPQCYAEQRSIQYERSFVRPLIDACAESLKVGTFGNPYNSKLCVAAAVAAGPQTFRNLISCKDAGTPPETSFANLDYNVYASIVGDCAWAPNGCDVTRQNLVDLVYSQIGVEAKPVWPESATDLIAYYITPIFNWTNTGSDSHTPYTNFNDWLHYAGRTTPQHCLGCPPAGSGSISVTSRPSPTEGSTSVTSRPSPTGSSTSVTTSTSSRPSPTESVTALPISTV